LTRTLFLYQHDVRNGWFGDVSAVEPVTSSPNQTMVPAVRVPPAGSAAHGPHRDEDQPQRAGARRRPRQLSSRTRCPGRGWINQGEPCLSGRPSTPTTPSERDSSAAQQPVRGKPPSLPAPRAGGPDPPAGDITRPTSPPPVYMPPAFRAHQSITPAPPTIATHAREKKS
jgi:hypothetical protein